MLSSQQLAMALKAYHKGAVLDLGKIFEMVWPGAARKDTLGHLRPGLAALTVRCSSRQAVEAWCEQNSPCHGDEAMSGRSHGQPARSLLPRVKHL